MMMLVIQSLVAPIHPVIPPEVVCLAGMFLGGSQYRTSGGWLFGCWFGPGGLGVY